MNPNFQSKWIHSSSEESFKSNESELSIWMNPSLIRSTYFKPNESELICSFQSKFRILMNLLLIQIIILLSFKNSNITTVKPIWEVEGENFLHFDCGINFMISHWFTISTAVIKSSILTYNHNNCNISQVFSFLLISFLWCYPSDTD